MAEKYTYQSDSVSGNTQLNPALWEEFHAFRFEWELPQSAADATTTTEEEEEGEDDGERRRIERGYVRHEN